MPVSTVDGIIFIEVKLKRVHVGTVGSVASEVVSCSVKGCGESSITEHLPNEIHGTYTGQNLKRVHLSSKIYVYHTNVIILDFFPHCQVGLLRHTINGPVIIMNFS